ncbi:MAG: ATP-binding protein [Myxococcota bacterium]|nr:ATP-binding protein [Myxococcota bacterium]
MVWESDALGVITSLSARWLEYTGVPVEQALREGWACAVHPEDVLARGVRRAEALDRGEAYSLRARLRRRDGAWRWNEIRGAPVRDGGGGIKRWVGTLTDVDSDGGEDRGERLSVQVERAHAILEALVQQAPLGIAIFDRDLRYLEINEVLARMDGRPRHEHIGRRFEEVVDAELATLLSPSMRQVIDTGVPIAGREVTWRWQDAPGGIARGIVNTFPIRTGDRVIGIALMMADVSDRRQIVDALAASERRFRTVHDASSEGFLVLRAERAGGELGALRCVYGNQAASHTLSASAIEGADLRAIWPAIERTIVWGLLMRAVGVEPGAAAGEQSAAAPAASTEAQSVEVAPPGRGAGSWFRCSVVPLGPDEVALRFDDITARKRGEQALAIVGEVTRGLASSLAREEMLAAFARSVAATIADVCAVHLRDATGRVRCIAAADAATDAPITRSLADLFRTEDPETGREVRHGLGWVLRSGATDLVPEVGPDLLADVARDESARVALEAMGTRSWIFVPITVRGEIAGALTLESAQPGRAYDLADRVIAEELARRVSAALDNVVLYEEAQRANALKDEFLSIASHELRTPLSTILGWSKLLIDDQSPTTERIKKGLTVIQRNAQAQARIVDDILDTSRILRNKIALDEKTLAVAAPMEEAVDLVRSAADERGIELELELDREAMARADGARLRQIFFHLLSNAVKFTSTGGRITARVAAEPGAIAASVRDNGAGIDPSFLPYLFDRFRQADASSTRKHGGLGLGLAIARKLAELHGGTISVASEGLGHGATFTVRLPDRGAKSEPGTSPGISIAPRAKTPDLVGVRVLLVDDHDDARELYGSVISLRGARVTLAASAAEARARLRESRFDVLVSDIAMPYEDGCSLVQFARAHDPVMRTVAISAYTQPDDVDRAIEAGFERYLFKPVDTHELAKAIADLADVRSSATG